MKRDGVYHFLTTELMAETSLPPIKGRFKGEKPWKLSVRFYLVWDPPAIGRSDLVSCMVSLTESAVK